MDTMLSNLEKDTGFRVRVLCQAYPNTPGLAVRDYWDLGKEVSICMPCMVEQRCCAQLKMLHE